MRSPILAAILSLIVAGLGQIYNGQIGKGVIFICHPAHKRCADGRFDRVVTAPHRGPVGHDRRVHDREAQQRAVRLQVVSVPWTNETC
jgi:hypothetical protein